MENKESLEATAIIGKTPNLIEDDVYLFFSNGIMTPRIYQSVQNRGTSMKKMRAYSQLLAASSFPVIIVSGWKSSRYLPVRTSSMTFGSRSM